jgi:phosphoglycolate phosphatase-like HAD superfamily hydrolase
LAPSKIQLILWDVDGTLVDSSGLGRAAFEEAFEHVTGSAEIPSVPFAGRTDLEIALDMLGAAGIAAPDEVLKRFGDELERAMAARAGELRRYGRALPGAAQTLARLDREPGVVQSLLTGNIEPNAAVKLGAFGLGRHLDFEIGAYGSDHHRRGELVAIARSKAARKHGGEVAPDEVVLIGDTPLDVAAAKEGGARAVGVATGPYGEQELEASGADAVLSDLADVELVIRAVLSP